MFNVGMGELLLVLLVAYVIVGPKDLQKVARCLGRCTRKIRSFVQEFKKESGWDDAISQTAAVQNEIRDVIGCAKQIHPGNDPEIRNGSGTESADHEK